MIYYIVLKSLYASSLQAGVETICKYYLLPTSGFINFYADTRYDFTQCVIIISAPMIS